MKLNCAKFKIYWLYICDETIKQLKIFCSVYDVVKYVFSGVYGQAVIEMVLYVLVDFEKWGPILNV